jgi:Penicillin-insensitive murein endopeptidase
MYIRTGRRSAQWPPQYGLGDAAACAPDAATNGRLCSFNSQNGGSTTAVYVPDAARGADPLSLIVWIHGLLVCGGEGPDAVSYLKSKTFPLTRQIADSKRPFVLVVPTMNWRGGQNSHPLGSPQKMNAFLDEVRAGLTAAGWSSPPSFGRLILAGHSKAFAVLNGLAAGVNEPESSQGALATLTDMWLLDSTYGTLHKESLSAMWLKWAKAKGNVNLRILYRRNSDTAPVAERIRDEAARAGLTNVAVEDFDPRSLGHCEMPRVRMPYLLAGAGGRAPGSTGASVPRPTPLPRPTAPHAPQPSNGPLFQRIQNALASGQWYVALGLAVMSGNRDANGLTNMLFFARHPELKGRKLLPTEPNFKQLSREWLDIRDRIVRPYLAKTPQAKPSAPPPTTPLTTPPTIPVAKPIVGGKPYPEVNTPLPPSGPGFVRRHKEERSYGLPETIRALVEIAAAWNRAHPQGPRIAIGDISPPGGSLDKFEPHSSHRVGLDVDLNLEGGNASWQNKKGPKVDNRWQWVNNPTYSRSLTKELARLIVDHPKGGLKVKFILFDDPEVWSVSNKVKIDKSSPHRDHLHVRFCAPPHFHPKVKLYQCEP